jgi:hypothetical protein
MPRLARWLVHFPASRTRTRITIALMKLMQWRLGMRFASQRYELLRQDEYDVQMLAFAGKGT